MAGKKFYAVAVGRVPGIYDHWPTAQAQVSGFPGARFKGFASRREAEDWLAAHHPDSRPPVAAHSRRASCPPPRCPPPPAPPCARRRANPRQQGDGCPDDGDAKAVAGRIIIYTDGGAIGNPGPGGYGAVVLENGRRREISGGFCLTTNNRMELTACLMALESLSAKGQPVALYSDSSYVVNGISKGWAAGWRRRGWRKADGQPALNPDLWQRLLKLSEELEVTFIWVRGHAGNPLNERCDQLAVAAARQPGLPPDPGYLLDKA